MQQDFCFDGGLIKVATASVAIQLSTNKARAVILVALSRKLTAWLT
jgi:hypothetical protein